MHKASIIVPLPEAIDKGEEYWVFVSFFIQHIFIEYIIVVVIVIAIY